MASIENTNHAPVAEAAEEELGAIKQSARRAVRAVSDRAGAVADTARATYDRAVDGVKAVAENPSKIAAAVRDVVRDNPLKVVATVALAALALGSLLRRPS
jgi:ElaB/YqjD/DUF883 family membrane-anchored ribosome-binding protein